MPKNKIQACVDVPGRVVIWRTESGSRLYGETIRSYVEPYKPENALYESQRFLRSRIVVQGYDGRIHDLPAEQEDLKRIGMVSV